jgi:CMP-N-acetylneuraminic acid synthetase
MRICSVIIARGGSKGIPRKNLADLDGKPLVAYMIEKALSVKFDTDVVLSTEDEEIAMVGKKYGALVPFKRPKELAEDHITSLPVVQHAIKEMEKINGFKYDIIVYIQPTAPLCRVEDIEACMEVLISNSFYKSAVTAVKVATHPFKMKRLINGDQLVNYIDQGFEDMRPRQALPPVYRRSGAVYASRRAVVMEEGTLVGDPCKAILVPEETAVDIDRPVDLELVRFLIKNK